jgi:hypothetical protein
MPIIEKYNFDPTLGPRNCQQEVPSNHKAELILHEELGTEVFLCKTHAAIRLSKNPTLLAQAVVELALKAQ